MPSFDVVSQVNLQEVDNAVNQAIKEVQGRYDLKNTKTTIEWKSKEKQITLVTDDDYRVQLVTDILQSKLIKRGIDIKNLDYGKVEPAGGMLKKQVIKLKEGIDKEAAKKITTLIKDSKLKVQSQVMDEQVRVTGKSTDDLQSVIQILRASDVGVGLQFTNRRD
ncbi:MAG: YajQ family cyclic di-GMP-binding protein [Bdellovibrionales bacterium]|nr:YajQ family cyclic di-GMP-binding protein [Bdellovibrionales bacterium]